LRGRAAQAQRWIARSFAQVSASGVVHKLMTNNLRMRDSRYLANRFTVAVLTCLIGLTVSWSWQSLNRPQTMRVGPEETVAEPLMSAEPAKPPSPGSAGNGRTRAGVPFSFTSFRSPDGADYFQWSEIHRSYMVPARLLPWLSGDPLRSSSARSSWMKAVVSLGK